MRDPFTKILEGTDDRVGKMLVQIDEPRRYHRTAAVHYCDECILTVQCVASAYLSDFAGLNQDMAIMKRAFGRQDHAFENKVIRSAFCDNLAMSM
ncbi:hypothetical protein G7054_g17 [Neopestalotiopsis clavispora]|nr:hypothetical protein G7054_g17 [Neopestalotiopsis clavispora]